MHPVEADKEGWLSRGFHSQTTHAAHGLSFFIRLAALQHAGASLPVL